MTTKIHAAVDALGNPVRLKLTGGQVHDSVPAIEIISDLSAKYFIADKAYDVDRILEELNRRGFVPVIPPKRIVVINVLMTVMFIKSAIL